VTAHLAELELRGPEALLPPASELAATRAAAEADPDVWAVLIRAAGSDPLASAEIEPVIEDPASDLTPWAKPLILAATGTVSGRGFELALNADVLVATAGSSFVLPPPATTAARRTALGRCFDQLPYRVVTAHAMARRPLSAERAHDLGFVNELATPETLGAVAQDWAERILAASPLAAAAIGEAAIEGLGKDLATAIRGPYSAVADYASSADAAEAVKALVEGRRPLWRGH